MMAVRESSGSRESAVLAADVSSDVRKRFLGDSDLNDHARNRVVAITQLKCQTAAIMRRKWTASIGFSIMVADLAIICG